jgi:hypothetical protein
MPWTASQGSTTAWTSPIVDFTLHIGSRAIQQSQNAIAEFATFLCDLPIVVQLSAGLAPVPRAVCHLGQQQTQLPPDLAEDDIIQFFNRCSAGIGTRPG